MPENPHQNVNTSSQIAVAGESGEPLDASQKSEAHYNNRIYAKI